jgi:hypothetical protein
MAVTRGTPPGEDFNDTLSKALGRHGMSWQQWTCVTTDWPLNVTGEIPGACVKDVKMLYVEHVRMEKNIGFWLYYLPEERIVCKNYFKFEIHRSEIF